MVTRLALLAAALVLAAPQSPASDVTQTERERKVKVALALASAPAKPVAIKPPAPAPISSKASVKLDWFGDEPLSLVAKSCPCGGHCKCAPGTCPANCPTEQAPAPKAVPVNAEYRTELRQECWLDSYGRKHCQLVEYRVPIESGSK